MCPFLHKYEAWSPGLRWRVSVWGDLRKHLPIRVVT